MVTAFVVVVAVAFAVAFEEEKGEERRGEEMERNASRSKYDSDLFPYEDIGRIDELANQ